MENKAHAKHICTYIRTPLEAYVPEVNETHITEAGSDYNLGASEIVVHDLVYARLCHVRSLYPL